MSRPPEPCKKPISREELVNALDAAGYPLEIEVCNRLQDAGLSSVLGTRHKVQDDGGTGGFTTREIDVLAQSLICTPPSPLVRGAHVRLRALIDVKKMHEPHTFAGICGVERTITERRSLRCRIGGSPSWDLFSRRSGDDAVWIGSEGFATCLDAMDQGLWCVQWAVARRQRGKTQGTQWPAVATHDDGFHNAFLTLERASLEASRSWTEFLATRANEDPFPEINMTLNAPTVIVATPTLYAWDPIAKKLRDVQWLTIEQYVEHRGHVRRSIVDIVCLAGLDDWIAAMKQTSAQIEQWLVKHAGTLKR